MASLLQVEHLTKSFDDRILFSDITFGINEGDKIGLIAKNGMGKTTLLRCLAGLESADSGSIVERNGLRMCLLEQMPQLDESATVLHACMQGAGDVVKAVNDYEIALKSGDAVRIADTTAAMDAVGAWDYEDRLRQLLSQLGVGDMFALIGTLSGGQRKRVAIARAILQQPQLLLLDEPSNHLDIESIEWLEGYLSRAKIAFLMVTHDRYLLDRVCTKIFEIDRTNVYEYAGNYDNYLRRRQERIDAMSAELAKVKNLLRKEQEWMNRQPQARAGKAKYRIDNYYDLRQRAAVDLRERNVSLQVKSSYIGSKIFEANGISKRFGDKVVLDDFNYIFSRYEKVGIIGHNGVGKSTFIKMLLGEVMADSGSWDIGQTVNFGYYSQQGISFRPDKKVIDVISEIADDIILNEGQQRLSPSQFLQQFLFTPADQQKLVAKLSGGEKSRLYLASILIRQPNFLVLDEPTNNLDIVTLGVLEQYLADFKGCAIIVSHDRFFLDSVVDHLFVFEGDGVVKDFPGNYSDYREMRKAEAVAAEKAAKELETKRKQKTPEPKAPSTRPAKLSFKERKEMETLESELESLNAEKAALEAKFNSGETLPDILALSARYEEVKLLLDDKELRWLELSEKA